MAIDLHKYANPKRFLSIISMVYPWSVWSTVILIGTGLYMGLFVAPPDYQQGDTVRIMFVHVPAAWMALMIYMVMAVSSAVGLIWKHPVADLTAKAAAPIGAAFTFLSLVSGSLWGRRYGKVLMIQPRPRRPRRSLRSSELSIYRSFGFLWTGGTRSTSRPASLPCQAQRYIVRF